MDVLIVLLFILSILVIVVTVAGHLMWLGFAAFFRWLSDSRVEPERPSQYSYNRVTNQLRDLDTTEKQIVRFYRDGKLNDEVYEQLIKQVREERERLVAPTPRPVRPSSRIVTPEPVASVETPPPPLEPPPSVVTPSAAASDDEIVFEPVPSFLSQDQPQPEPQPEPEPQPKYEPFTPPPPPRRPFSEVLNSFMEQSNIRWGEIIGGVLIIGCSTALVVSLWAQISEIPVLKFLIFTTVTAVLFGIGLYTEHRWKLPTTSRGILTIATLLVPLNFLAIAAVSASNTSGVLVIGSEVAAPAIFLCLVYFAGRIITPGCAQILAAGVLGSSIGQLLVRHLASTDTPPALLIFLGAFPVLFYVVTVGLALRIVLHDREIDESETTTVFTIIGAMSFAALLPFGLLLYKSGPMSLSMMYLAPIITLWGLPLVATGTVLWRRISNKDLVASRTTGTALGILGVMIVLAGMILAWPNPASIIPAALLNFAIFSVLAIALRVPAAHLLATICFALAFLVTFHVFAGNITWVNLRQMSLLDVSLSVSSGQALIGAFALFIAASEWLKRQGRERDGFFYVVSACLIGVLSLALATVFGGLAMEYEYNALWIVYGLYAIGALWIAWRHKLEPFTWIGSALLLFSLAHSFGQTLGFSFPWQTALFAHATICSIAAIFASRYQRGEVFTKPLNYSALISIVLGVVSLFQANTWEVTWMQAQRVFWIAGILLPLLWLNRRRLIFNAFQVALLCALVLTVKAALQQFDWYSYLPLAFLRPAALQIQGTVLALFCLLWLAFRFLVKRYDDASESWLADARRLLDTRFSVDRIIAWSLLGAFLLLAIYGSLSGITRELAALGNDYKGFNIADFPHHEAFGIGSWVVLGLLLLIMLANFWDRHRGKYLLGALAVLTAMIPLVAGQFERQIATATSWRFLAAIFFFGASVVLWYRSAIARRLRTFGWPDLEGDREAFKKLAIGLLIVLTVLPLIFLTVFPALRALYYLPIHGPTSGIFSWFGDDVSYGFPLVLAALVMIGYALRERMIDFAFYAGVLFNATVTLAFLLAMVTSKGLMDRVVLVNLTQLNAIACAVYLLVWTSTRRRWRSALNESDTRFADFLMQLQLGILITLNVLLFAPVIFNLIWAPLSIGIGTIAAGSLLGWFAFLASVAAIVWFASGRKTKVSADVLVGLLLGVSCLVAFSLSTFDGWIALHIFTVCPVAVAWLMFAASELSSNQTFWLFQPGEKWQGHAIRCAVIVGGIAVFLSLRTLDDAAATHWWSIAPLLAITLLAATLNWKTRRHRYIWAAGILFNLAVSIWWIFIPREDRWISSFLFVNLISASLAGIVWLWLELRSRKVRRAENQPFAFHDLSAVFALVVLGVVVVFGSVVDPFDSPLYETPLLTWGAFVSLLAFMTACLWDIRAKYAVAGLYFLGLIAGGIAIGQSGLSDTRYAWSITILLAAYTLAVALLWHRREQLIQYAGQFGIPRRVDTDVKQLGWLAVVTVAAVIVSLAIAYWINLTSIDFALRVSVAVAVAVQFLTFGLMAEGTNEQIWRRVAVAVLVIGAILAGWSWLTPGLDATWLNRSVILMLEAFGFVAVYGLLLDKVNARWPMWTNSAKACVPWLVGGGALALFFCLGTEVWYQLNFGAVTIHPVALTTIGLVLAAAVVLCVVFALSPAHDPLGLTESQRTGYVYAGEVLLVLLFVHIRLTLPWLFTGFLERYWPLVVMVVAYFGVVASEALRRHKLFVLAHPLERTGAFLPLLPVIGFWVASSEVDFSLLLFVIGGLYGLLSILRRSFLFGLLAALAGNAGLWYAFNRTADYGFLQHPQLWLIPIAVSVLVAAYLNEDKLDEDQMTGIRYLALVTIYVSSTADIFINGAANSPWLPLILGTLSLAGVFAGIVFRIRGLLFLGSIFLLLSIITMIWYASVNLGWTWLWYVAGIVTGATIIFMFALFEKKRSEVLRVVEGLKEWDR